MATNIENLQTRVEEANTQIEQSKTLSAPEKMQKAKDLESIISQIKTDLDSLRVSATPEELAEIDALTISYEDMDAQFNLAFKSELSDLADEVTDVVDNVTENTVTKPLDESTY
jgi:hypothetical protein